MKTKEVSIRIICDKIPSPRPWKYEVSMVVFGKKRFLTYGNTIKDAMKVARRRLKTMLLKNELSD